MSLIFTDPRSLEPPPDLRGRASARDAFLSQAGLGDARRVAVAGDASTRGAYTRLLRPSGPSLMLMDAPPAAESRPAPPGASAQARIAQGYNAVARLAAGRGGRLRGARRAGCGDRGLSAPELHALDVEQGFAVLEDLGDDLFVRRIASGEPATPLYETAVDLLIELHAQDAPPRELRFDVGGERGAWALPTYDALALKLGCDLFLDWWPKLVGLPLPPQEALEDWASLWAPVQAAGEQGAEVFVHRDFHAENLLWLPDRAGPARVGLLDFQDAVRGHRAWGPAAPVAGRPTRRVARARARYARPLSRGLPGHRPRSVPGRLRRAGGAERLPHPGRGVCAPDRGVRPGQVPRLSAPHLARAGARPATPGAGGVAGLVRPLDPGGQARVTGAPKVAMVLAAGIGSRMRPLTDARPKALVEVAGKPLIDHTLDRLAEAGVERAVVNVHHFADQMQAHLAHRSLPRVTISDERAGLLDSAGGIAHARAALGEAPIFVANIDNVWIEHGAPALATLAEAWDPAAMDVAILLAPRAACWGYGRPEGFLRDEAGRLTHSNSSDPPPPFNNIGFQILKPQIAAGEGAFSIVSIWKRLAGEGRLFGAVTDAEIIHVSSPSDLDHAQSRLGARREG